MTDLFDTQPYPRVRKVPTGIPGVDDITGGGIPRNRTTLAQAQARINDLQHEMALRTDEIDRVLHEESLRKEEFAIRQGEIRTKRGADLVKSMDTSGQAPPEQRAAVNGGGA